MVESLRRKKLINSNSEFLIALLAPAVIGVHLKFRPLTAQGYSRLLLTLGLSAVLWAHLLSGHDRSTHIIFFSELFYRDILSDTLSLFYTLSALVIVAMTPRHQRKSQWVSSVMLFASLITAFLHANHVVLLGLLWLASVPLFAKPLKHDQTYLWSQVIAMALFAVAASWLYFTQGRILPVSTWLDSDLSALSNTTIVGIATLILICGSLQQGLFPFHGILKSAINRFEFPMLLLLSTANMGIYLIIRFGVPLINLNPEPFHNGVTLWISLVFIALAISALTISNLRKFYVSIMCIQSSLIFTGYLQSDALGEAGALVQWIVALVAGTGFGLCVWLFEARTGTRRLTKSAGCFDKMPRLAILFLIFGMAVVDVPSTLGFVGEDLLIHSILKASPVEGVAVLAAMACASIAIYRSYVLLFLGRKLASHELIVDIAPREAYTFLAILVLLVGLGCYPQPLAKLTTRSTLHDGPAEPSHYTSAE